MSALHIADTGFFVALGNPSKERYQRVRTFAKRNEIVFVVPERIYGELTGTEASEIDEAEAIPIDVAIDDGWVRVADPLEYTNPGVSKTIDLMNQWHATLTNAFGDQLPHKGGDGPEQAVGDD